ncbi:MAG: putative DNA binding domain-containing protein [Limnospira sp. PMC 894.15]|uniref:RNA-binding domain-containing protein n=1 Tax=Limnospira sp. PMC 894.15 TaxID=2981100 RepID=UPI0028E100B4|nr:RNA-binding domain-containing protein [Limnospira sp. PMC 894.15]MDT9189129.1 putative DNA binding domain-containing protein [Limnospira sp. PMC 894.15]
MDGELLLNQIDIGEDQDIEFKSADSGLPKDIWETVSAFANTDGGYIVLGVTEKKGSFVISGVRNPKNLQKIFWDNHNNEQKLNVPICTNNDVKIQEIDNHSIVSIRVPKATRKQRPVYINNNPLTGTFKRNYEGDYRCTKEEVQQMLRDTTNDPQDIQILDGFDLRDIDIDTLTSFRQRFRSRDPDHPWLAFEDRDLLRQLRGWGRDRSTGKEGLTIAGLLMFGRESSILDALPNFQLDYQELLSDDPETRWTYRLTLDGKWEPNLFNFYYRVYNRLVNDLEVPFKLDRDAVRRGETHVQEALREALVNTLIHADHQSTRPLKIIKYPNRFLFSNPGCLRISRQQLYEGGVSDPRNPNLQKMFQMLGLSEKAGSGFGKILRAWREQQWFPVVTENLELEMTKVTLPMVSMIPENIEKELREVVGDDYCKLTELDRIILILAHQSGEISNADIQCYSREHPREIGECLKRFVNNGWLERSGRGRGTLYALPNKAQPDLLSLLPSSEHYEPSSEHYEPSSEHYEPSSEHYQRLEEIAAPVRAKSRISKEIVEQVILKLCSDDYLPLRTLADLLKREPDSIRNHYVNPMLKQSLLEARYPNEPTHPQQAYRTLSPPEITKVSDPG